MASNDQAGSGIDVSVVVIGRNEGERLSRCLDAVRSAAWGRLRWELIYIDSRSSDDSAQRATAAGARVHVLPDQRPNAAKARNAGWRMTNAPLVLFLDGDTELHPDFVNTAKRALGDPTVCAAWGHRRESRPRSSLFNWLLDLDWVYAPGRTLYFGGDVLVRRAALEAVGGFDPALNAGEEPELCTRLRAKGWQIEHLDAPMTMHDLAIHSFRGYWLRAYRSGMAYAEVAQRARAGGDPLWQREARRDLIQGAAYATAPLWLAALLFSVPQLAGLVLLVGSLVWLRTAWRSRWKSPAEPLRVLAYALHVHVQKVPAFFGQWAFRRNAKDGARFVDYREPDSAVRPLKRFLLALLRPCARIWRATFEERLARLWWMARLQSACRGRVDGSSVMLGPVAVHGTGRIRIGKRCLFYGDIHLETQGDGIIDIGDDCVLSRGVHIVAFERVRLGNGVMVGEYSGIRDANHALNDEPVRQSGHVSAPIDLGDNVWLGRNTSVLKGVRIGDHAVLAAHALARNDIPPYAIAAGLPAQVIGERPKTPSETTHD
jgi:acetyltransferase-like isoleucine patch superfamily enzyme/glycosyltransferase involved in cell wall biosynthesis